MIRAPFIVFEGIDGAGTSTQSGLLTRFFEATGIPVDSTREPGGTPLAEKIRDLVLDPTIGSVQPAAELLLYAASRAQHVRERIEPNLSQGKVVICDRFTASSMAYQGYGRGLPLEWVQQVNAIATQGLAPDLTVFLQLSLDKASKRRENRVPDRLEKAGDSLQWRVSQAYKNLAAELGDRALVLDGALPVEVLADKIKTEVTNRWPQFF